MTGDTDLTVVMYHYVRPVAQSTYPRLKALEFHDFKRQLDYLAKHYTMITPQDLLAAQHSGGVLPPRACLLTFDDGYCDHYEHVFPELTGRGLSGVFFAPYSSLVERRVLEVNKIQFVLETQDDPNALADELDTFLHMEGLGDPTLLRTKHHVPNRFDTADVAYTKRLLQHVLPPRTRSIAVNTLFERHVTSDEPAFAEELYMNVEQAIEMRDAGMEFGGHGDIHLWHGQCSTDDLEREVAGSTQALQKIGAPVQNGFYCYPFGDQNSAVRDAIHSAGYQTAFTVEPLRCNFAITDPLQIPRLDTRDIPMDPNAAGPSFNHIDAV